MNIKYLNECFNYNPETGDLTWKSRPKSHFRTVKGCNIFNGQSAGKVAGNSVNLNGKVYRTVYISFQNSGSRILQHRIAWSIFYGCEPVGVIDHINGNGEDNRIENLRDVTMSGNHKNKRLTKGSESGVMGVSFMKSKGKWRARINSDGVEYHLGLFENIEDATAARKRAEIKFNFHKNHGRVKEFADA